MLIPYAFKWTWKKTAAAVFFCLLLPAFAPGAVAIEDPFTALQQRLIADGFDARHIESLYRSPDVAFETRGVSLYFIHREARLNYGQFTTDEAIGRARAYMQQRQEELLQIEKAYAVEKEVITAIMLVETGLGTILGKRSVLSTYSSLASLQDPEVRRRFWLAFDRKDELTREAFDKKADRKAAWAYRQLKAFLQFADREKFDPIRIRGSYAGALGIAQFIPTTAMAYAEDGDGDGRINLFEHIDAMASIAGFLKAYGWRPGIDLEKKKAIIHRYNHSSYYVNTILEITSLLQRDVGKG